jgi:hypothetical protein
MGLVGALEAEKEGSAPRRRTGERNQTAEPLSSGRKEGDQSREHQREETAGRSATHSSRAHVELEGSPGPEWQRWETRRVVAAPG